MKRALALVGACCGMLSACAGGPRVGDQWLDERTGVTILQSDEPIVFARTETRYSRSGRDYVYLGPVETNRQGVRDYFLWVGIGTTLDRGYLAPDLGPPDTLYLPLPGDLIELELQPWPSGERRGQVYDTAVELQAELRARVTLYQLALLAAAPPQSLQIAAGTPSTRRYVRWDRHDVWPAFLERAGAALR